MAIQNEGGYGSSTRLKKKKAPSDSFYNRTPSAPTVTKTTSAPRVSVPSAPRVSAPSTTSAPKTSAVVPTQNIDYQQQLQDMIDKSQSRLSGMVNNIYDQLQQSQLSALKRQQEQATNRLNQQQDEYGQQIYGQKNQASVNSAQSLQRLRELMAAQGLGASGENVTAQTGLMNERQNSLNELDQQQNNFNRQIATQLSEVNDPRQEREILDQLGAQRSEALMNAQNTAFNQGMAQSQFAYQMARDQIKDKQWQAQFDEDVRQFGLNYGLSRQVQLGNLSLRQAEQSLQQSKFAYQKQQDSIANDLRRQQMEWEQSQTTQQSGPSVGENLNNYVSTLNDRFLTENPMTGERVVSNEGSLYRTILGMNLDDDSTTALLNYYGVNTR